MILLDAAMHHPAVAKMFHELLQALVWRAPAHREQLSARRVAPAAESFQLSFCKCRLLRSLEVHKCVAHVGASGKVHGQVDEVVHPLETAAVEESEKILLLEGAWQIAEQQCGPSLDRLAAWL